MASRMINYGYQIKNASIEIMEGEAIIVREIFERYSNGETLKSIADSLTKRGERFYKEKNIWNKSMISRIIQNERYTGKDNYPRIITDTLFKNANTLKEKKSSPKITYTSNNSIGTINPIRYRSYYYDTDTGFYYLQTRYYDPAIRRFINVERRGFNAG